MGVLDRKKAACSLLSDIIKTMEQLLRPSPLFIIVSILEKW